MGVGVESIHYPFKQPLSVNGLTWGSTSRSLSHSIHSVEKKTTHTKLGGGARRGVVGGGGGERCERGESGGWVGGWGGGVLHRNPKG